MSEMIGRVAAALKGFVASETLETGSVNSSRWDEMARTAIEAMREPTDEMLSAASEDRRYGDGGGFVRHEFEQEYRQAIDAALGKVDA
jgi:hypothetical protein